MHGLLIPIGRHHNNQGYDFLYLLIITKTTTTYYGCTDAFIYVCIFVFNIALSVLYFFLRGAI